MISWITQAINEKIVQNTVHKENAVKL